MAKKLKKTLQDILIAVSEIKKRELVMTVNGGCSINIMISGSPSSEDVQKEILSIVKGLPTTSYTISEVIRYRKNFTQDKRDTITELDIKLK